MLKTELMINDWVLVPLLIDDVEGYKGYVQIRQLRDCDLDVFGFKELEYDEIKPIPVTADILLANGFEVDVIEESTYVYSTKAGDGYTLITLTDELDGLWNLHIESAGLLDDSAVFVKMDNTFLKVHQLQHAIKFAGINKDIKL